jgi:hypothetical protein
MLRPSLILLFALAGTGSALAEDARKPLPATVTIGYEGEGKIEADPEKCLADAREIVEWSEDETKKAGRLMCAARKRHADAYAAMQASYRALVKHVEPDHRLNPPEAFVNFAAMVKACIDHKTNINTGGHNIYIDIITNDVAADCLRIGKNLLDQETAWFGKGGWSEEHPAP